MPEQGPQFDLIPFEKQEYYGTEKRFAETSYEILKADTTTLRIYDGPSQRFWLFLAYFNSQEYGSQIHSPKHCLPGGGWQILRHEP